jgi:hypothetical protein
MTITETLALIAESLGLFLDDSGGCASHDADMGQPRFTARIVDLGADGPGPWAIAAEINVPAGIFSRAGDWATFRGDLARVEALQGAALAIIGGRTWTELA